MNKKLLITMGCSLTEGVGCYDLDTIPNKLSKLKFPNTVAHPDYARVYFLNMNRFHEFGWPNRIGKKLGFDKVINLGIGGGSTSGQVKNFLDKYPTEQFKNWDVLIMFMLPEPARISFYLHNKINDLIPSDESTTISSAYLNSINNLKYDPVLEQVFYIKILQEICSNRNFNFLYFNHSPVLNTFIQKLYPTSNQLINSSNYESFIYDGMVSPLCNHPNEDGYELISEKIYKDICQQFPQYVHTSVNEIEWEYNGDPMEYDNIIDNIERFI